MWEVAKSRPLRKAAKLLLLQLGKQLGNCHSFCFLVTGSRRDATSMMGMDPLRAWHFSALAVMSPRCKPSDLQAIWRMTVTLTATINIAAMHPKDRRRDSLAQVCQNHTIFS